MSVTISSAVKSNLAALQTIQSQANATQNILSTGKKVNSALDNATSFFTAQSLNSRSTSLTNLLDGVSNGIQTIQAANTGITSISKLVDQLKSTGQQALAAAGAYTNQASTQALGISGATAADLRGTSAVATAGNTLSSLTAGTADSATSTADFSSLTSAAVATETGTVDYSTPGSIVTANQTVTVTTSSGTVTATFDSSATDGSDGKFKDLATLTAALNRNGNTDFTASIGSSKYLKIDGADQSKSFTVGGSAATALGLSTTTKNATAGSTLRVSDGTTAQTFVYDTSATSSDALRFKDIADLNSKLASQNIQASAAVASSTKLKLTAVGNNHLTVTDGSGSAVLGFSTSATSNGTAGDILSISDGSISKSYIYDTNATAQDTNRFSSISDLNTKLTNANVHATATEDGGKLKLAATNPTTTLTVGGSAQGSTKLNIASTIAPSGLGGALQGKSLSFVLSGGGTTTVTFGDPATTAGTVKSLDDLNSKLSSVGLTASIDSTGKLGFTTTSDTASQTFTVKAGDAATATATGFTQSGTASSGPVRGGAGANTRDSLVTQYNGLLQQINTLAKDSSFNGLNLLNGDTLNLTFNETNTSKLSVTGTDASFTGLGLNTVSATDFNDGDGIQAVLSSLDGSKTTLANLSSKLGANLAVVQTRQDFTKNLADTLSTGADNLVNADMNEEATNLLALQTSQSLAQSALSLANQSNQGVLRLLQG